MIRFPAELLEVCCKWSSEGDLRTHWAKHSSKETLHFVLCNYCKSPTSCCLLCWTTGVLWQQLQKELFGENLVLLSYQAAEITRTCPLTSWLKARKCLLKILCQFVRWVQLKWVLLCKYSTVEALVQDVWKHELYLFCCLQLHLSFVYYCPALLSFRKTQNIIERISRKKTSGQCLAENDSCCITSDKLGRVWTVDFMQRECRYFTKKNTNVVLLSIFTFSLHSC